MKTIIIDPGHGGYDVGAINGIRFEKNDTLRLGIAVKNLLVTQSGVRVIMTRETDVFVPLTERVNISNKNYANIFVSLHRNSSTNTAANGVENFVAPNAATTSILYARNVLYEVIDVGVQNNRGISQGDFYVLRYTNAPAQLLELGFISNEMDNIYFDRYLSSYAMAIARGIMDSLGLTFTLESSDDRKNVIRSIQATLNNKYGTRLTTDGIYGPSTRRAIVQGLQMELNKQYDANLVADGIFGSATRAAIRGIRRGADGNIAYLLQASLFVNGYNPGVLDGVFGRATEEALIKFQLSRGLTPDGIAGPATFSSLLSST